MTRESGAVRTVGVGGLELTFQRNDPDKPGRKVGDRKLAALWVAKLDRDDDDMTSAIVNEFDDGVLFGPSSLPGVISDFAGAAAAEITVRWLQRTNERLGTRLKRQRDIGLLAAGLIVAVLILVAVLRG